MTAGKDTFTLAEANRRLPLVRRIVADIIELYPGLRERALAATRAGGEGAAGARLDGALQQEADRIDALVRELESLGCSFKGFEEGLVDFPARLKGRTVCLCWRYDEPSITYWHELSAGYAGRQPITPEVEATIASESGRD
jgi:hypothetical protein